MVSALLIVSVIIAVIAVGLGAAFFTGALDDLIAPLMEYIFKAKAKAQVAALKAQGKKEGEDFIEGRLRRSTLTCRRYSNIFAPGELSGNKQASSVAKEGMAGMPKGLKGL